MTDTTDETGRLLLAAIIAHPDEDTPRLLYADWLEERDAAAPEYVECPGCRGAGYRPRMAFEDAGGLFVSCEKCARACTVRATARRDHAELIRVQCELARPCPLNRSDAFHIDEVCEACDPPWKRSKALLAALAKSPGWLVPCPVCDGTKVTYTGPGGGQRSQEMCSTCSGTGTCPHTTERGFLHLRVPTMATVWVRKIHDCWCMTGWAERVRDQCPHVVAVECGDRVPHAQRGEPNSTRHGWVKDSEYGRGFGASCVPVPVWDAIPQNDIDPYSGYWKWELTTAAATRALAFAVAASVFAPKESDRE
jgi:uncharacterized protein (TIGR02996 family)